jgi:glycosyltransferase involved in cell wall biosynthesis
MKNKNDITVITPLYNVDETLLNNAINSIAMQETKPDTVMFVVGTDKDHGVLSDLMKNYDLNFDVIKHDKSTDFQAQMNLGVENCKSKWFIFLEQDDELSGKWVSNVVKYREVYTDTQIFLPIILDVDPQSNFIGFTNEAVWASQFSDEMGVLDNAALLRYQNFNMDGMAMLKEAYQEFGGLKESMKLSFISEFLLRFTFNSCKVMIIPKLGYKHLNDREGSLFNSYKKELTPDESRWWLSLAKKEYFHVNDRNILYEKTEKS